MLSKRYTSRGVHQRKNGKWELYFTDNATGRRIARTVPAVDENEARSIQKKRLAELNAGVEAFDCGTTVDKALDNYINMLVSKDEIEASTESSYRSDAKVVSAYLGKCKLSKLTTGRVDKWMADMKSDGYSKTTISRTFHRLKSALNYAQANDLIPKNPCAFTHPPKMAEKKEYTILDDADRARLLRLCVDSLPNRLALSIILAAGAGLRREEVCGLRASDYDERKGVVTIRRAISLARGGAYVKAPKTLASVRSIPVEGTLKQILDGVKETMRNELKLINADCDPYLTGDWEPEGHYYHPTQLSRDFAVFRSMNGFPANLRFHDLRHGWVTLALEVGSDVGTVASYAGHAKPSQTLNVYCNPNLDARRKAAAKVDARLWSAREEERWVEDDGTIPL